MANEHMRRCSISLVIREMPVKTQTRYHFTPTRMAVIKKTITSVGDYAEKLEPSYIVRGSVKWFSHFGKQSGSPSPHSLAAGLDLGTQWDVHAWNFILFYLPILCILWDLSSPTRDSTWSMAVKAWNPNY